MSCIIGAFYVHRFHTYRRSDSEQLSVVHKKCSLRVGIEHTMCNDEDNSSAVQFSFYFKYSSI